MTPATTRIPSREARMTEAHYLAEQALAASLEAGPPPPMDASTASWLIFAAICAIALVLTWPA